MNRLTKPVFVLGIISFCLVFSLFFCPSELQGDLAEWAKFIGEFHPMLLHLPIGAVVLCISMEIGKACSRGKWRPQTTWVVFFAAATSVPVAILGYASYAAKSEPSELLQEHMRDGIIFTLCIILVFLLKFAAEVTRQRLLDKAYVIFLFLTTLLMLAASHHGGEYTHGELSSKAPWRDKAEVIQAGDGSELSENSVLFTDVVQPIFAKKCYECHSAKEDKGDLRMDTWIGLEHIINEAHPEDSLLLESIQWPLDHDEHMPPAEDPQLTQLEIAIIQWWATHGFDRKKSLKQLGFPVGFLLQGEEEVALEDQPDAR